MWCLGKSSVGGGVIGFSGRSQPSRVLEQQEDT